MRTNAAQDCLIRNDILNEETYGTGLIDRPWLYEAYTGYLFWTYYLVTSRQVVLKWKINSFDSKQTSQLMHSRRWPKWSCDIDESHMDYGSATLTGVPARLLDQLH